MTTFKKGDRVVVSTDDVFDGETGVVDYQSDSVVSVTLDTEDDRLWFGVNELDMVKPPAARRLTVRRNTRNSCSSFAVGAEYGDLSTVFEGEFDYDVEEIDPIVYVQVDYSGVGVGMRLQPLYTYIDPTGGNLRIGDLVEVPVTYGTKVGIVAKLGRGNWTGECKTVAAHLIREALV
jgi:hypothetical protein